MDIVEISRIKRLNAEWALSENVITAINGAVGAKTGFISMECDNADHSSPAARLSREPAENNGGNSTGIRIYTLDEYFKDIKISLIKADVEGYEEQIIKGAVNVIKRDKPRIAFCIYHNATDMYSLALLLKDLNPDYRFDIRQHYIERDETVLYAY